MHARTIVASLKVKVTIQTYAVSRLWWKGVCFIFIRRFDYKINISLFDLHGPSVASPIIQVCLYWHIGIWQSQYLNQGAILLKALGWGHPHPLDTYLVPFQNNLKNPGPLRFLGKWKIILHGNFLTMVLVFEVILDEIKPGLKAE